MFFSRKKLIFFYYYCSSLQFSFFLVLIVTACQHRGKSIKNFQLSFRCAIKQNQWLIPSRKKKTYFVLYAMSFLSYFTVSCLVARNNLSFIIPLYPGSSIHSLRHVRSLLFVSHWISCFESTMWVLNSPSRLSSLCIPEKVSSFNRSNKVKMVADLEKWPSISC